MGYLVSVCVPADDDGLHPARHQTGDVATDDRLPEHGASKDVPDGSIWRTPHLLQLELLHTLLVWCDGGTLDAYVVTPNCFCCLNGHLVVCCISVLHAKIKALQEERDTGRHEVSQNVRAPTRAKRFEKGRVFFHKVRWLSVFRCFYQTLL